MRKTHNILGALLVTAVIGGVVACGSKQGEVSGSRNTSGPTSSNEASNKEAALNPSGRSNDPEFDKICSWVSLNKFLGDPLKSGDCTRQKNQFIFFNSCDAGEVSFLTSDSQEMIEKWNRLEDDLGYSSPFPLWYNVTPFPNIYRGDYFGSTGELARVTIKKGVGARLYWVNSKSDEVKKAGEVPRKYQERSLYDMALSDLKVDIVNGADLEISFKPKKVQQHYLSVFYANIERPAEVTADKVSDVPLNGLETVTLSWRLDLENRVILHNYAPYGPNEYGFPYCKR